MKIILVKTSALGDLIQVFPVVSYLKQKFPHCQIDWVVEAPYAELAASHPAVSKVIPVKTKLWRKGILKAQTWKEISEVLTQLREASYDVAIDLQGNSKSAFFTAFSGAKEKIGFGWKTVPEWPNLLATRQRYNPSAGQNIRKDYLAVVQQHFKDFSPLSIEPLQLQLSADQSKQLQAILDSLSPSRKVMVCPGSAWPNKMLKQDVLEKVLADYQQKVKCQYLFTWGSIAEKELSEALNRKMPQPGVVLDRLPFPVLQNLMAKVDLVIAMDSLPLHLAGATSTPTFSVFGPSMAEKYAPDGPQNHALQGTCPYGRTFEKRCPILRKCSTGACMSSFTPEQILDALPPI